MSLEILTSPTEDDFRDKLLDLIQKYNINLSQKILDLD